jgi:hypothetical protein
MATNRPLLDLLYERKYALSRSLERFDVARPRPGGHEGDQIMAVERCEKELTQNELVFVNKAIDVALGAD